MHIAFAGAGAALSEPRRLPAAPLVAIVEWLLAPRRSGPLPGQTSCDERPHAPGHRPHARPDRRSPARQHRPPLTFTPTSQPTETRTMSDTLTTPDYTAIKQRQQAAWSSGDYSRIGVTLQIVGESLAEALDLPAGATALDVAAGNGNATLALARRGADVVSTDYVESLLDRGARAGRSRGPARRLPGGGRRGAALCRRRLRRRRLDLRRDVRARPGDRGRRARPGLPGGRTHRPRELDAGQLHRRGLPPDRALPPAARRREAAVALGRPGVDRGDVRPDGRVALARGSAVRLPLRLAAGGARRVPHLLRTRSSRPSRRSRTTGSRRSSATSSR